MFDHVHHHAATPPQSTCARATVCKSHDDRCGSNMKAVRFEDDRPKTHHSDCPIHGTSSHEEDRYNSYRKSRQHQSQCRESITYRWVWGPPLPVVAPRREKTYYGKKCWEVIDKLSAYWIESHILQISASILVPTRSNVICPGWWLHFCSSTPPLSFGSESKNTKKGQLNEAARDLVISFLTCWPFPAKVQLAICVGILANISTRSSRLGDLNAM